MDFISELLKICIPALIVFFTAFILIRLFLKNETEKRLIESKAQVTKETTMLRLQAYERMILFLERIDPSSMVMRMDKNKISASNFHLQLLATIRTEFEHNLAQQLYISNESWQKVINTKEEIIKQINLAKGKMKENNSALDLTKIIIANSTTVRALIISSISMLKKEASQLF